MNIDRAANLTVLGIVIGMAVATVGTVLAAPDAEPEGSVIVGVQGPGAEGQAVTVDEAGDVDWRRTDAASYHDVTALNDSHVLAAYGTGEDETAHTGFRIINRTSGQIARDWNFSVATLPNSEVHDAERLPSGEIVVADMEYERILTVAQNGSVTWQWNASQHYDGPADPTAEDWLHINDVDRIGEGRYLVSVRNAHQLLIVERGDGVVEVINEDRDTDVLDSQHNPQWLGDGRVLVADSENNRAVELQRQPNGTWLPVWSVSSAGGQSFYWPRDADRLADGSTLITDSRNHRVVRVGEDGDIISEWATPELPYEAELSGEREPDEGPHLENSAGDGGDSELVQIARLPLTAAHHAIGIPAWLRWWHVAGLFVAVLVRAAADIAPMTHRGEDADGRLT